MKQHFVNFWATQVGKEKIYDRAQLALDTQDAKLLHDPKNHNFPNKDYANVRDAVYTYFEDMKEAYWRLDAERDFVYAFHVFPYSSIGHLHMHVFPKGEEFRVQSARQHDWKTVPVDVVLEVEGAT